MYCVTYKPTYFKYKQIIQKGYSIARHIRDNATKKKIKAKKVLVPVVYGECMPKKVIEAANKSLNAS